MVTAAAATAAYKTGESVAVAKPAGGTARWGAGGVSSSSGEAMAEERDERLVVTAAAGAAAMANELAAAMVAGVRAPEEEAGMETETTPGLATAGRVSSRLSFAADAPTRRRVPEAEAPAGEATAEREANAGARAADGEVRGLGLV